ncbi:hypothetical protein HMPREF0724_11352 [Prescottella equi ATCC 33707]|uniref:Uncharacterized protein n=1 Tax=Prescottella equi ATCC 33707 TaxID=525370 RepID=E9SZ60_RHOHA|nr:hypothetical protein HMPREF0724_11352 [Prescottella equi ATCC 33707]
MALRRVGEHDATTARKGISMSTRTDAAAANSLGGRKWFRCASGHLGGWTTVGLG